MPPASLKSMDLRSSKPRTRQPRFKSSKLIKTFDCFLPIFGDDGLPSFSQTQAASDGERGVHLVYYAFDLLHLDGRDTASLPLIERKALLEPLIIGTPGLQFNGHETGEGETIRKHACKLGFEGVVSKTIDAPYAPGNRGLWRKSKCLNRQEFVVVGWTDPEGWRPHLGALLLGYYTDDGRLIYAGRVGTGMPGKVLADLRRRLAPLARTSSPLSAPPPRKTRFGSPLILSQVHSVEPQLVAEITYLTWTSDGLLRQTVYIGLRTSLRRRCGRKSPAVRSRRPALRTPFSPRNGFWRAVRRNLGRRRNWRTVRQFLADVAFQSL
jgi:ATP-dependent DNA ligase